MSDLTNSRLSICYAPLHHLEAEVRNKSRLVKETALASSCKANEVKLYQEQGSAEEADILSRKTFWLSGKTAYLPELPSLFAKKSWTVRQFKDRCDI